MMVKIAGVCVDKFQAPPLKPQDHEREDVENETSVETKLPTHHLCNPGTAQGN